MPLFEARSLESDQIELIPADTLADAETIAYELIRGFYEIETIRKDDNRWNQVRYE